LFSEIVDHLNRWWPNREIDPQLVMTVFRGNVIEGEFRPVFARRRPYCSIPILERCRSRWVFRGVGPSEAGQRAALEDLVICIDEDQAARQIEARCPAALLKSLEGASFSATGQALANQPLQVQSGAAPKPLSLIMPTKDCRRLRVGRDEFVSRLQASSSPSITRASAPQNWRR